MPVQLHWIKQILFFNLVKNARWMMALLRENRCGPLTKRACDAALDDPIPLLLPERLELFIRISHLRTVTGEELFELEGLCRQIGDDRKGEIYAAVN